MKRWIALLILALLLTGCASQEPNASTSPGTTAATQPSQNIDTVPDAPSVWYAELGRTYTAVAPMGDGILLFGNGILTRNDRADLMLEGNIPSPSSGMLQIVQNSIVYYDAEDNAIVTVDDTLTEQNRIQLDEAVSGSPYLSANGKTLYYCTDSGIRVWDADTGISRNLKIHEGNWLGITGAPFDGRWLRCQLQQPDGTIRTLLISAQNGETVAEGDHLDQLITGGDYYCCPTDFEWVFGIPEQRPHNLLLNQAIPLPQIGSALTLTATENGLTLDLYDLATGLHTASECIPQIVGITCITPHEGKLIFLSGNRLYTWDYTASAKLHPVEDSKIYIAPRYTVDDPDLDGLAACQTRAEELEQLYGIDILLWQDIAAVTPEGYQFSIEHRTLVYSRALDTLEAVLAQFPAEFMRKATSWTEDGTLHIVLAKSITVPENVCAAVNGTQYLLGKNAYMVLELGTDLERSFYHTLGHIVDAFVLTNSAKFYEWHNVNPSGFAYDNNYTSHQGRESKYLEGSNRYFVNSFAMSYPVEDRATLLEYAMLAGNDAIFESKYMQAKLKRINQGLRDAFSLTGESYPWEQYLK